MASFAVLGAGNMGTALAHIIAGNGHDVRIWSIETDVLDEIELERTNSKYLRDLVLHDAITVSRTLESAIADAHLTLFTVPSHIVRRLAKDAASYIRAERAVLNVAKGLEEEDFKPLSEVLEEELGPHVEIAVMGGPAIANEFVRGTPTAVIVASRHAPVAKEVQTALQNQSFKVAVTADVTGVEMGACLKNAYAIALGMCDGMGLHANTKAFLASLAVDEMASITEAMGGQSRTAYGLAGLGDLLTTGYSVYSRNRTFGERLSSGDDWREFQSQNTVEGIAAAATIELARQFDVNAPLLHMISEVVHGKKPAAETMRAFLRDFSFG
jgi:glycerol-3-phosphate dehydrogenase (NAD(P)+)